MGKVGGGRHILKSLLWSPSGPDKIRPLILKELRVELAPIIKVIFERSLETGKLPTDWCKANVTPIYKKGDNHWHPTTARFP